MRTFLNVPTRRRQPEEGGEDRWASHRVAALAIRTGVRLAPVLVAVGVSLLALHTLPESFTGKLWPGRIALITVSVLASIAAERIARRALPLAVLLQLTLLFPDRAPSRLKVARGGGQQPAGETGGQDRTAAAERVLGLLTALTSHDRRTRGHCERVRVYADMLGAELNLSRADQDRLRWAALLHDIGKLEVDAELLNKPAKPSEREWLILQAHPAQGARLAAPLLDWLGEWGSAIEQHHERFDGTGYPRGLSGEDISRAGRLLAIVDAYEVMTAARAYKRAMSARSAREELARCAGTHFDPPLVRAFLAISLPRLLWTTGPFAFAGQLPLLRQLGQFAERTPIGGAVAAKTAAALVVASVAVTGGVTAPVHTPREVTSAAAGAPKVGFPVNAPPPPASAAPAARPPAAAIAITPTPVGTSAATVLVAEPTPTPTPTPPPVPTPPPAPVPDTTPPVLTFTAAPAALTNQSTAHLAWTTDDPTTTTTCQLDTATPTTCTTTYDTTGLPDGPHTLTINTTDTAGNTSTWNRTWTLDTTGPQVTITQAPSGATRQTSTNFVWSVDDPAATVTCQLDATTPYACSGNDSLSNLTEGTHTYTVTATDALGNIGNDSRTWTVDTIDPVITVTGQPIANLIGPATISWTIDDPAESVTCALDGGAPTACSNSYTVSASILSNHTLVITATDAAGNTNNQSVTWFQVA